MSETGARRATITSSSPLRVRVDGSTAPLGAYALAGLTVTTGDRVYVLPLDGASQRLILGKIT